MSPTSLVIIQILDGGAAMALAILAIAVVARTSSASGRLVLALGLAVAGWYGLISGIAAAGGFGGSGGSDLGLALLGLSLLAPLAGGAAAMLASSSIRRLISKQDMQPGVIGMHSLRIIPGAVFLAMALLGVLPAAFAVPAGAGDILIGLIAASAATWLRSGHLVRVLAWNVLGVIDLVLAVTLGIMTSPGSPLAIGVIPTSSALLMPPLVVVPAFLVPFYLLLHMISLRYLALTRRPVEMSAAPNLQDLTT